ncbi:hypothetical protein DV515_00016972 [Chloebia gouldiae]|uniref:Uncharacterized protein n=1 Tax=Chloebia gouldiae TaxID=44316 RepID=A0A3L8RAE3_CHLGU|nr:hypothetical protein DV515_00016977 [Chloebia gouldiae]RLV76440.1 hypothetical protein DV515_00016972 [Chloebia gouldiae]
MKGENESKHNPAKHWGHIVQFMISHLTSIAFPQGQLNEDKLRCKLRVLENQLQACAQSYSKECVKKILIEMEDQKQTYEQKAKEALQKMLEDKLLTEQQLQNSQVSHVLHLALIQSNCDKENTRVRERR